MMATLRTRIARIRQRVQVARYNRAAARAVDALHVLYGLEHDWKNGETAGVLFRIAEIIEELADDVNRELGR